MRVFTAVVFAVLLTVSAAAQQPPSRKPTTAAALCNLEVLSDTQGVDFGPYLSKVVQAIRQNWLTLIPAQATVPQLRSRKISIEFNILRNGRVAGMKIASPSGDIQLDRAAWGGITASAPFAPLPEQYSGRFLALRLSFRYIPKNMAADDASKKGTH